MLAHRTSASVISVFLALPRKHGHRGRVSEADLGSDMDADSSLPGVPCQNGRRRTLAQGRSSTVAEQKAWKGEPAVVSCRRLALRQCWGKCFVLIRVLAGSMAFHT